MTDELKTELNKMLMKMYEKGLNDGTESVTQAVELAIDVAVSGERNRCISIIENYKIHVGASTAGEIACDMTYAALREIRDEIKGVEK